MSQTLVDRSALDTLETLEAHKGVDVGVPLRIFLWLIERGPEITGFRVPPLVQPGQRA